MGNLSDYEGVALQAFLYERRTQLGEQSVGRSKNDWLTMSPTQKGVSPTKNRPAQSGILNIDNVKSVNHFLV